MEEIAMNENGLKGEEVPSKSIVLIFLLQFLHQVLLGSTMLVLPLHALELGASEVELGFLVGMGGIGVMLLSVPLSVLSDHLGRRPAILGGFAFWVAAATAGLLASSIVGLGISLALIGFAQIGLGVCGVIYLMELTPEGKHAQMQSLNSGVAGLGLVIGPAVGGFVYRALGYGRTLILVTVLSAVGLLASYLLRETRTGGAEQPTRPLVGLVLKSLARSLRLIKTNRGVDIALLLTMLGTMGWMTVGPSLYLVHLKRMHLTSDAIGVIMACMAGTGVLFRFGFGPLAKRIGTLSATLLGWALGGLALMATPFLGTASLLALTASIGDGADRLRIPGIYTVAADATEGDDRSLAIALIAVAWGIANVLSPPLLGLVATKFSLAAAFILIGAFTVVGALVFHFRSHGYDRTF